MFEFLLGIGVGCLAASLIYYIFPKEDTPLNRRYLLAAAALAFLGALGFYLAGAGGG